MITGSEHFSDIIRADFIPFFGNKPPFSESAVMTRLVRHQPGIQSLN